MTVENLEDVIGLTDEEFMNQNHHALFSGEAEEVEQEEIPASSVTEDKVEEENEESEDTSHLDEVTDTISTKDESNEEVEDPTDNVEDETGTVQSEINYKDFYEKATSPFKAAGQNVELKSPEELIQLAQKGLDYTRKLQELSPHRKLLMSLEQNEMLSEEHVNYLIDLKNKNPDAIKKLIKESGIDPWELSSLEDEEVNYQPNSNIVTDAQVVMKEKIQENWNLPYGQDTLNEIKTWDVASKNSIAEDPSLISLFREQKETGVYDLITAEANRLRQIGSISANTSFIEAYVMAGNSLDMGNQQQTANAPIQNQVPSQPHNPRLGATPNRPLASSAARAAAPPKKTVEKKSTKLPNPFTLSDEEFLKNEHLYAQYFKK